MFSGTSAEAEVPHPGPVVALDPIAVNLAGGGYLKVGITLQLTEEAGGEGGDIGAAKALDLVISQSPGPSPPTSSAPAMH